MLTRLITAVIVHYGDQRRTVRAVLNHWKLDIFTDIVVVANDMTARPEGLKDVPCQWLIPDRNVGFGSACQLGAMMSSADIYVFFNAHVTIDRISVVRCANAFDREDIGIAAPFLYYPIAASSEANWKLARCIRTYSRVVRWPIQVPLSANRATSAEILSEPIDTDWVSGAALFCRREVIRDVQWDGSYFLSVEDVDISMRTKGIWLACRNCSLCCGLYSGESTSNFHCIGLLSKP